MFEVGQRVVCVGGKSPSGPNSVSTAEARAAGARLPDRGAIYTIRQIDDWPDRTLILLEEVCNRHLIGRRFGYIEPGFWSGAFRPVIERKTSIAVFEAMLHRAPADAVKHLHELAGAP